MQIRIKIFIMKVFRLLTFLRILLKIALSQISLKEAATAVVHFTHICVQFCYFTQGVINCNNSNPSATKVCQISLYRYNCVCG